MHVTLAFTQPGYIEHPYWPEMYRLIEIDKKSGINRARTEANRRRALQAYLEGEQMTLADYEQLKVLANRPFHVCDGRIVIPREKVLACLVNASDVAPSKLRIPNLRTAVHATDFGTEKAVPDGMWERFAVVTMGTGAKASNQRGLRRNAYINDFTAVGELEVEADMVEPRAVLELLAFAGRSVGIGASRKMGWGRFTVQAIPDRDAA